MKRKILASLLIISAVILGVSLVPQFTQAATSFKSPLCSGGTCNSYKDFIDGLWKWAIGIAIPLSVLVIAAAGVVWTTSEGNPDRIGLAKKLIWGVVSGLGLIILARVLLVDIIGIDENIYNNGSSSTTTSTPSTSGTAGSTPSSPDGSGGGFSSGGGSGGGGGGGGAD